MRTENYHLWIAKQKLYLGTLIKQALNILMINYSNKSLKIKLISQYLRVKFKKPVRFSFFIYLFIYL